MTSALSWPSLFFSVLSLFFLSSDGTATTYLGCFYDRYPDYNIRALPLGMIKLPNMTIGVCINHCLDFKHRYAGVEAGNGDECWCGVVFSPQIGKRSDTECNIPCPGNSSQTCGADFRIQVYDLMMLRCKVPQFDNGIVAPDPGNLVQVRASASLKCDTGYNLTGQNPLQCIVGNSNVTKWDKEPPECQAYSTTKRPIATESTGTVSQMTSKSANTAAIIAGSLEGAGLLFIVLVVIVIIVCIRKRNQRTKTGENHQQESRRANNNNDDQLRTSATAGQNMYDHTPNTAQPNNSTPLYAVVNQTTPPPVVKTASKRPTVQAYAYTDCTVNSPTMPNGRANNDNDDQLSTSVTVGQNSKNPLAETMYDHTPTAQPNNSIPVYAVVNQTTPPPVVKMSSKRPTDPAYAYTECSINPPKMPNGDRQPIFADGDVTSAGGRDSGWVDNNIYARTDNNGGEEDVDNAAYATVNRNQEAHAAVGDEEKEGWAENSIYVTSN